MFADDTSIITEDKWLEVSVKKLDYLGLQNRCNAFDV